jgi:hypothetical protein
VKSILRHGTVLFLQNERCRCPETRAGLPDGRASTMTRPGRVILDGIMGSGKSTTVSVIAASLSAAHRPAHPITETTDPHPVRATDGLPHWHRPWLDVTPDRLVTARPRLSTHFSLDDFADDIEHVSRMPSEHRR